MDQRTQPGRALSEHPHLHATITAPAIPSVWQSLYTTSGRLPTQSPQWCLAAADAFHIPSEVRVIWTGDGMAPMAFSQTGCIEHLVLLSQTMIYEPMDLLYRDESAAEQLLRTLLSAGHPILLDRIDADSALLRILTSRRLGRAVSTIREHPGCPVIPLSDRWTDPAECLSSRRRQDLRRAYRKARQYGAVQPRIVQPAPQDLAPLLDTVWNVEAASWKGTSGTALKRDTKRRRFFETYAYLAAERGELTIALLYLDNEPAAVQLAVETLGAFWILKIGYDQRFAACSPGQILMSEVIAHAVGRQLKAVEFLGSIEPWTQAWTQHERKCATVTIYPYSAKGLWALGERAATSALRKLKHPPACNPES